MKTDEPIRARGWTYWHHLFTPRQLLLLGTFINVINGIAQSPKKRVLALLSLGRFCNYNSKLSRWDPTASKEMVLDVFSNQALNTNYNFGSGVIIALEQHGSHHFSSFHFGVNLSRI